MTTHKLRILSCLLILGLLASFTCWVFVRGQWMDGMLIGLIVFIPFVFTASLLLCYLLGLGKEPPKPDN